MSRNRRRKPHIAQIVSEEMQLELTVANGSTPLSSALKRLSPSRSFTDAAWSNGDLTLTLLRFGSLDFRRISSGFSFSRTAPIRRVTNNEMRLNHHGLVSRMRFRLQER